MDAAGEFNHVQELLQLALMKKNNVLAGSQNVLELIQNILGFMQNILGFMQNSLRLVQIARFCW